MAVMLTDPSLHTTFLNHGGLERILEELRLNIKRDDLICSVRLMIRSRRRKAIRIVRLSQTDYNSTIPACAKILRLLVQYHRHLQKKFSLDTDLLKLLFKSIAR